MWCCVVAFLPVVVATVYRLPVAGWVARTRIVCMYVCMYVCLCVMLTLVLGMVCRYG